MAKAARRVSADFAKSFARSLRVIGIGVYNVGGIVFNY